MKQIQRGAALLTVLALLCTLTLPAAAASDTVTIATVQDLIDFSKQCTRDTWSQGITVELTADLDLSGSDFTPVPIFQGTFHGNSHTISGFSFEKKGSKTGLFRTLTASAVVEDLTVEGDLAPQGSGQPGGPAGGRKLRHGQPLCRPGLRVRAGRYRRSGWPERRERLPFSPAPALPLSPA